MVLSAKTGKFDESSKSADFFFKYVESEIVIFDEPFLIKHLVQIVAR